MLISGVYYAIRTSAILTSLNVGLCGTDRRFIFGPRAREQLASEDRRLSTCSRELGKN